MIVPPETSVPVELEVKPTTQLDREDAVMRRPVNATVVTVGSIVYGTGSFESSRRSSSDQPLPDGRTDQREPAGVTLRPALS